MASPVHVIAAPYPGRSHINPMLIVSRLIAARLPPSSTLTVVITVEWLSLLGGAASAPAGVRFRTISNVIPSEHGRAADFAGFFDAVFTKMESPFERLLDELETPPTAIIADVFLPWAVDVGKRRGIPVFSLSTISATYFSALLFFDRIPFPALRQSSDNHKLAGESEVGENEEEDELISKYIDGHQSLRVSDFSSLRSLSKPVQLALEAISQSKKAQGLIFTTAFELEPRIITSLRSSLSFPILPIGPNIPYATLPDSDFKEFSNGEEADYITFLNSQPQSSVLYVSMGSFLSVSSSQTDEIAHGLQASNVKFLWVARDEASRLKEMIGGGVGGGMFVAWCDQLKVLCHPSVGGFLTHCGWNSTMEAAFAGVPVLTFPIIFDQWGNSRVAVEEWGVGMEMRGGGEVVGREKVAELVKRLMGLEGEESGEMRKKGVKLAEACRSAIKEGGSSSTNLNDLVKLLSPEMKPSVAVIKPATLREPDQNKATKLSEETFKATTQQQPAGPTGPVGPVMSSNG